MYRWRKSTRVDLGAGPRFWVLESATYCLAPGDRRPTVPAPAFPLIHYPRRPDVCAPP